MELVLFNEQKTASLIKACNQLAQSALVPYTLRGKPQDIFLVIKMGAELGLQEIQSLNSIHVIQGRPSISAQTMIALIRSRFPDAIIKIRDNSEKTSVVCEMRRCKEDEGGHVACWDMKKAQAMGLSNKDNWKKQPMTMLRWRAISEAARVVFPDVIMNMYTPDEARYIVNENQEAQQAKVEIDKVTSDLIEAVSKVKENEDLPDEKKKDGVYEIQIGVYKGKRLDEIDINELREYYKNLMANIGDESQLSMLQQNLIENLNFFLENKE